MSGYGSHWLQRETLSFILILMSCISNLDGEAEFKLKDHDDGGEVIGGAILISQQLPRSRFRSW